MTIRLTTLLDQTLRAAGIPIDSVSIGDEADRATWRVQFRPEATTAQKAQAQTVIAGMRVDADALADAEAQAIDTDKVIRALVIWVAGKVGVTPAQAKAQIVAIYKTLT